MREVIRTFKHKCRGCGKKVWIRKSAGTNSKGVQADMRNPNLYEICQDCVCWLLARCFLEKHGWADDTYEQMPCFEGKHFRPHSLKSSENPNHANRMNAYEMEYGKYFCK